MVKIGKTKCAGNPKDVGVLLTLFSLKLFPFLPSVLRRGFMPTCSGWTANSRLGKSI